MPESNSNTNNNNNNNNLSNNNSNNNSQTLLLTSSSSNPTLSKQISTTPNTTSSSTTSTPPIITSSSSNTSTTTSSSSTNNNNSLTPSAKSNSNTAIIPQVTEKPSHYTYLKEFRVEQCTLFLQHKCTQHRPYTCFNWHFKNQRRRRPIRKRDGTFNYNPDVYCDKYDEQTGLCPGGDDCPYVHRNAGDTEKRYHLRYYKTASCIHETDAKGHCVKNGAHCAFAHGPNDLRPPVYDVRETQVGNDLINDRTINLSSSLEKERLLNEDPKWNDTNYVLINYKTEPCKRPPRLCRQGFACPQYHNARDKRRNPSLFKYRSTPCPNVKQGDDWLEPSVCENGDNCKYCHSRTEQQFHPEIYKSSKCNDMLSTGYCPRGPFCAFAHLDNELKTQRTHSTSESSDYTLENFITNILPKDGELASTDSNNNTSMIDSTNSSNDISINNLNQDLNDNQQLTTTQTNAILIDNSNKKQQQLIDEQQQAYLIESSSSNVKLTNGGGSNTPATPSTPVYNRPIGYEREDHKDKHHHQHHQKHKLGSSLVQDEHLFNDNDTTTATATNANPSTTATAPTTPNIKQTPPPPQPSSTPQTPNIVTPSSAPSLATVAASSLNRQQSNVNAPSKSTTTSTPTPTTTSVTVPGTSTPQVTRLTNGTLSPNVINVNTTQQQKSTQNANNTFPPLFTSDSVDSSSYVTTNQNTFDFNNTTSYIDNNNFHNLHSTNLMGAPSLPIQIPNTSNLNPFGVTPTGDFNYVNSAVSPLNPLTNSLLSQSVSKSSTLDSQFLVKSSQAPTKSSQTANTQTTNATTNDLTSLYSTFYDPFNTNANATTAAAVAQSPQDSLLNMEKLKIELQKAKQSSTKYETAASQYKQLLDKWKTDAVDWQNKFVYSEHERMQEIQKFESLKKKYELLETQQLTNNNNCNSINNNLNNTTNSSNSKSNTNNNNHNHNLNSNNNTVNNNNNNNINSNNSSNHINSLTNLILNSKLNINNCKTLLNDLELSKCTLDNLQMLHSLFKNDLNKIDKILVEKSERQLDN